MQPAQSLPSRGAWIEMSFSPRPRQKPPSLPSRGAWIEMPYILSAPISAAVAPLAGSVDRNYDVTISLGDACRPSLPSRGAWIEIVTIVYHDFLVCRRSPRGERG